MNCILNSFSFPYIILDPSITFSNKFCILLIVSKPSISCDKVTGIFATRAVSLGSRSIDINLGWNEKIFNILKRKFVSKSKSQRTCAIVVDGMKIKSGLTYNVKKDLIDGFEDLGEYGQSQKFAQQAIVFMIKGKI